ncbi:MgtC/SapB family protein [Flavisphingomonas formosensis]|uniref:MgtC/SapB family protein n=1 Tax=Flavisphingomonas formosensis TaxID=861534 RepID=UPI0012F78AEF|nr:DUF4010 domain-containing protein [Sphingomonas formosensis]
MGEFDHIFLRLIAAAAAGLLVGLERGWTQRNVGEGRRIAGFRTFGLFGLGGGLCALVPDLVGAVLLLSAGLILAIGYARDSAPKRRSATSSIAAILTLAAGFLAVRVSPMVGLASAATIFVLLSTRQSMHALLKGLSEEEMKGVARFALVAFIVLPFLPNSNLGPFGAWNPQRIWLVVVFVIGLSFVGYVANRRLGSQKGTLLLAFTGAIVSSTAVTADLARRLRTEPDMRGTLTAGIAIASLVMFLRVQLLVLIFLPRAFPSTAAALAPACGIAAGYALLAYRRAADKESGLPIANPLGFGPAFLLAAMVAVLSLLSRWALATFGSKAMAIMLSLTGMSDVDATILTIAGLPESALDDRMAGATIISAVLANTAVKAAMTIAIGWRNGGWRAARPLLLALLSACVASSIWWLT